MMECNTCNENLDPNEVIWISAKAKCPACGYTVDIVNDRALYDGNIAGKGHRFMLLIPKICNCNERVRFIVKPCGSLAGLLFVNVNKVLNGGAER